MRDNYVAVWSSDCTVFFCFKQKGFHAIITLINFNSVNIGDKKMKINYNGLWKILIDKDMNKKDLTERVRLAPATVSKMGKGEFVSMEVLYRIAIELNVDFGDMISVAKDKKSEDRVN